MIQWWNAQLSLVEESYYFLNFLFKFFQSFLFHLVSQVTHVFLEVFFELSQIFEVAIADDFLLNGFKIDGCE